MSRGNNNPSENDMHTAKLNTTFYRGAPGSLRHGQAYFCSCPDMAAFYGPVSSYELELQSPKFVSTEEWARFDSTLLRFDNSAVTELVKAGHDSAVVVMDTPKGQMITVFAVDGLSVSTKAGTNIVTLALETGAAFIGINEITEENYEEVYMRHEMLRFAGASIFGSADNDFNHVGRKITLEEVKDHIGLVALKKRVHDLTEADWKKRLVGLLSNRAKVSLRWAKHELEGGA